MTRRPLLALISLALLASAPAAIAQTQTETETRVVPTIPETQIEPTVLSSPYEFLSVATSVNEFVIEAAALAETRVASDAVRSKAAELAEIHAAIRSELIAAGKTDGVEIAKPAMDGEQQGLLKRMEALNAGEFDHAYIASQVWGHQRAIAYYRGYATQEDAVGMAAAKALPTILADYAALSEMNDQLGAQHAAPQ
jgi:predicted outer membrane protein